MRYRDIEKKKEGKRDRKKERGEVRSKRERENKQDRPDFPTDCTGMKTADTVI